MLSPEGCAARAGLGETRSLGEPAGGRPAGSSLAAVSLAPPTFQRWLCTVITPHPGLEKAEEVPSSQRGLPPTSLNLNVR